MLRRSRDGKEGGGKGRGVSEWYVDGEHEGTAPTASQGGRGQDRRARGLSRPLGRSSGGNRWGKEQEAERQC